MRRRWSSPRYILRSWIRPQLTLDQWTSCLTLISNYLSEQHIAHVKYVRYSLFLLPALTLSLGTRGTCPGTSATRRSASS
jgi:hypothetical protein